MVPLQAVWSARMGKGRNMEKKKRSGAKGSGSQVRSKGVSCPCNDVPGETRVQGGAAVEVHPAFGDMTPREQAIFAAGQHAGAAQVLSQMYEQHAGFVKAVAAQVEGRQAAAKETLDNLPDNRSLGARAGDELGRRVMGAGKALLGRHGD